MAAYLNKVFDGLGDRVAEYVDPSGFMVPTLVRISKALGRPILDAPRSASDTTVAIRLRDREEANKAFSLRMPCEFRASIFRVFKKKHPTREFLRVTHRYDDGIRTSGSNHSFRQSDEAFLGYNKSRLHNLQLIVPVSQEDADYMAAWLQEHKALWPYAEQYRTHQALASLSRRYHLEKTKLEDEQRHDIRYVVRAVERCYQRKINAVLKVNRVRSWAIHRQEREVACLQRQREHSIRHLLD
jgi:hypothetical protein